MEPTDEARHLRGDRCWPLLLSLPVVLMLTSGLYGQTPPTLEKVRIGLPTGQAGGEAGLSRNSAWAPVAVTLRGGKEGNPLGVYRLRIETTDLEEVSYQTTVPVPALAADSLITVQGYVVPGGDGASFRVHLESADGSQTFRSAPRVTRESGRDTVVGLLDVVYLAAGGGQTALRRTADKLDRPDAKQPVTQERGVRQIAIVEEVQQLPDRWIGYDAVDVVVLATGRREFVLQLAQPSEAVRREALLEWLRRGGKLILSVGRNKQEVTQLLARLPVFDGTITGSETVRSLPILSQWSERPGHKAHLLQAEVATLTVGPTADVLVRDDNRPLLVQSAFGLGRVLLVAFDLDLSPFTNWEGQEEFWTRLQAEVAAPTNPRAIRRGDPGPLRGVDTEGVFDLQTNLKRSLESFADLTPVSFGWVALFLLVYILLVGPIDYFILKRIVKRLELTWITFPVTVVGVSVAAYLTAYAFKGEDLRINKVDVVDVDMRPGGQAYGTSWFTLFSPRVASYTLGIEPAPGWTAPIPEGAPGPVVTLLEAGERTLRAGSQSLFRRPYEYADENSGLKRVPIPVWAARSFTASWRAPLAEKPPVDIRDDVGPIRRARDGNGLVGRLTNNLQTPLLDVALFYRDRWYTIGRLEPGEQRRLEPLFTPDAQGQNRDINQWIHGSALNPGTPLSLTGRPINVNQAGQSAYPLIKTALFFRLSDSPSSNAGLHRLDQSWRLRVLPEAPLPERPRYRREAILLARTPLLADQAEVVAEHPASASQLWVGALPGGSAPRPTLPGFLSQEAYLRIVLPVQ